jgi:hypothetical protein
MGRLDGGGYEVPDQQDITIRRGSIAPARNAWFWENRLPLIDRGVPDDEVDGLTERMLALADEIEAADRRAAAE